MRYISSKNTFGASVTMLSDLTVNGNVTISNTSPTLTMTDTTGSAKSLTHAVDANYAHWYESAGAAGDILTLDLANNQVQSASGTSLLPGIAFYGDADTGIYRSGANALGVITNAAIRGAVNSSGNWSIGNIPITTPKLLSVWGGDQTIIDPTDLGSESLNEGNFATHVKWDATGDFTDDTGAGVYLHSTAVGTLTQTSANLAVAGVGNRYYKFVYTVSGVTAGCTATVTTAFASASTALTISAGTQTTYFKSAASPTNFVIDVTSTAGGFTIDDVSLKEVQGGDIAVNGLITGGGVNGLGISGSGNAFLTTGHHFVMPGYGYFLSGNNGYGTGIDSSETTFRVWSNGYNTVNVVATSVGIGTAVPVSLLNAEAATGAVLTLSTSDTTVAAAGDLLGKINFQAPLEASGTDAILVGASIAGVVEAEFTAAVNATSLVFYTGASETATEKARLTSAGLFGIATTAPDKQVEINSATGANLRLTYNDANGSAANYADLETTSGGNLTITPSGGTVTMAGKTVFNKPVVRAITTLTFGESVAVDASVGDVFKITCAGGDATFTIANPTNPTDGQIIMFWIKQPASGAAEVVTWDTKYTFCDDIPNGTLSTTNSDLDRISFIYSSATDTWDVLAFVKGR